MRYKIYSILSVVLLPVWMSCGTGQGPKESDGEDKKTVQATDPGGQVTASDRVAIGTMGLKIVKPFDFKETTLSLDKSTADMVERQENFTFEPETDESVMISVIKYKPGLKLDLEGAKEGAIEAMTKYLGGNKKTEKESSIVRDGLNGIKYQSEIDQSLLGTVNLKTAFFLKNDKLVQIISIYKKEDVNKIESKVESMINSLTID